MRLVDIGFGSMISAERLVALIGPDSAPVKRMVQEAREAGSLIDATYGRRTRSILVMDSGHIVLSALESEDVAERMDAKERHSSEEDGL